MVAEQAEEAENQIVERRLRRSGISIPSPSRRILPHPTGHEVIRLLEFLQVVTDPQGHRHIGLDPLFHPTLEAIWLALSVSEIVFTTPPDRQGSITIESEEEIE
ncbi:hypothetical protein TPY_3116 [Sulfobacillus acidophilus TPY]|uniref:Uncharacterized protein n=1 Tax=Sulfobacillus acidophilus (strain ATCC 700253 / DSM 10332 / NAL) TaxID=679936 RepID=G8TZY8_SULAD|nr:hypothetical protein TPY_3116 [Sulfobacillus acidophilus TPY]AEW04157.1 hypothetical protein Sulac_0641 [Sulfobacillus acidophilus DSM 10332]